MLRWIRMLEYPGNVLREARHPVQGRREGDKREGACIHSPIADLGSHTFCWFDDAGASSIGFPLERNGLCAETRLFVLLSSCMDPGREDVLV
jgi:hypothetical protein